ncbi:MAG: ThiF family adenylyltransferase [Promethearchaeota archaeon]
MTEEGKKEVSAAERKMYARQSILGGWDQSVLKDATVFILGVGALGCEIAKDLALVGIGKMVLCDLDTIETSNLSRQMLFRPGDEGRPKAEVAAERLKEMNPFLETDFYFKKLQEVPLEVYEQCDVLIAALDNIRARMDLNQIAIKLKKPMVEGGTVGFEGHVQVIIPEGTPVEYGNEDAVVESLLDEKLWYLDEEDPQYKEYFEAERRIEELEEEIERLKAEKIDPVKDKLREEIRREVEADRAKYLDHTACYRCLVPIPPADQKLIAACTLKGIPQNREHCVLRADVAFRKAHERAPDLEGSDEDVAWMLREAQKELEALRERVFNENLTEEEKTSLSEDEKAKIRARIKETFGPDFVDVDMENILGNKIPAIQTVSSIISSLESQEALKLIFRMKGRDIGPPMDPPYINYNGVYGQFDQVPVQKREDCVACGKIRGEENMEIVVPFDGKVSDIFAGMRKAGYGIDEEKWLVTVPLLNNLILWDPSKPNLKDPDFTFKEAKLENGAMLLATATGDLFKQLEESDGIYKYHVLVRMV